jgi:glycosyltransferase involved in cell wall biosynthesis
MTSVAVVLVTHNAERWLEETLRSVQQQSRQPTEIIIVDDQSTDRTRDIIRELLPVAQVLNSLTRATDRSTRIAQNFTQGVRASRADVVVLGDHDDIWSSERIAHQVKVLEDGPSAAMVASSATLIDDEGRLISGTLRGTFPVPSSFNTWPRGRQVTFALARSIATGGVSAIRPKAFATLDVPDGWLHDRWWSITAVQQGGFILDDGIVAQYRVSPGQEVGLQTNDQGSPKWVVNQIAKGPKVVRRASHVAGLLWRQRHHESG